LEELDEVINELLDRFDEDADDAQKETLKLWKEQMEKAEQRSNEYKSLLDKNLSEFKELRERIDKTLESHK
jgi:hypothetical protein